MAFNIFTTSIVGRSISFGSEKIHTHCTFIKRYYNIEILDWERIVDSALELSNAKIGPKVYSIHYDQTAIEYQRVVPLGTNYRCDIVKDELIRRVNQKINEMHKLGYAHGDLHLDNIGFDDDDVYILDHDSVFRIADGITPWVIDWMHCMSMFRDWDGTFEEFIKLDYKWQSGWIS